jgi:histidyl-tRNA synthetase
MVNTQRQVVERFGYDEYDAPIIEPLELYLSKTSEEIVNEQTYTFEDRGGRKVVIRPEMTPTVSRMVAAKRQESAYPLRWYSIPNLWRYERPQRGRYREHWQLNVDMFGVPGIEAEYEMILISDAIFRSFGASQDDFTIKLNSRKLIDSLMKDYLGLSSKESTALIRLIDRMHKLDRATFISKIDEVLHDKSRAAGATEKMLTVLSAKQLKDLPAEAQKHPSVKELHRLLVLAKNAGIKNIVFDVTLMRGFDYYTDIV